MHNYLKQFNPFSGQLRVTQKWFFLKTGKSDARSEKTSDFVNRFLVTVTRKHGLDDQLQLVGKSESEKTSVLAQHDQEIATLVCGFLEIKVRESNQKKSLDDAIQQLIKAVEKEKLRSNSYHCRLLDKAVEAAKAYRSELADRYIHKKPYGRDSYNVSPLNKTSVSLEALSIGPISSLDFDLSPIVMPEAMGENTPLAIENPVGLDPLSSVLHDPVKEAMVRVIERITDPASDDDLLHNLHEVTHFLTGQKHASLQPAQLIPQLMAEFDLQIERCLSKNDWSSADRLTLKKLAAAGAVISWFEASSRQFHLPPPSEFGLLPGYKTRESMAAESGKHKPVVALRNGERAIVDNKKQLGEGGVGKVKTASLLSDGTPLAIKRVPLNFFGNPADYRLFLNLTKEVFYAQTLNRVSSDLFLNTNHAYVYDDGKGPKWLDPTGSKRNVSKVALVMEVACKDGEALASSDAPPTIKLRHMQSMATALAIMHKMGLAHQDFKLNNTVVTEDGQSKLADFGFVVPLKVPSAKFFNPEMVGGGVPSPEAKDVRYGKRDINAIAFDKVDVYAFGAALARVSFYAFSLHMLPDATPLHHTTHQWVISKLLASPDDVQHRIAKLISDCHSVDPSGRPSMDMVADTLGKCIDRIC